MTVNELKEILKNWPDKTDGIDNEVWVETASGPGLTDSVVKTWPLNVSAGRYDLLLTSVK